MSLEKEKSLSSNMEDYLEAIAVFKKDVGVPRVKDIARLLNVKNPNVNAALNVFSGLGFVIHEKYGCADLTDKGEELAQNIKKRHGIMVRFLTIILNIDPKIAEEEACKMEHSMGRETFEKFTKFMEFVEACHEKERPSWLESFDFYIKTDKRQGLIKRGR